MAKPVSPFLDDILARKRTKLRRITSSLVLTFRLKGDRLYITRQHHGGATGFNIPNLDNSHIALSSLAISLRFFGRDLRHRKVVNVEGCPHHAEPNMGCVSTKATGALPRPVAVPKM